MSGETSKLSYALPSLQSRSPLQTWAWRLLPFECGELIGLACVWIWEAIGAPRVADLMKAEIPEAIAHIAVSTILYVLFGLIIGKMRGTWNPDWLPVGILAFAYPVLEYWLGWLGDYEDWNHLGLSIGAHASSLILHWAGPAIIVAMTAKAS